MGCKKGLSEYLLFAVYLMLTSTISHEHTHADTPPHHHRHTEGEREKFSLSMSITVGEQNERGTLTSETLAWKKSSKTTMWNYLVQPECFLSLGLTFLFIHQLSISQQVLKDKTEFWAIRQDDAYCICCCLILFSVFQSRFALPLLPVCIMEKCLERTIIWNLWDRVKRPDLL